MREHIVNKYRVYLLYKNSKEEYDVLATSTDEAIRIAHNRLAMQKRIYDTSIKHIVELLEKDIR